MNIPEPDWVIDCEPREVQLEATRRSFYGYALKEHKDDEGQVRVIRESLRPARGWGHLMEMRLGKTPTILNEFTLFQMFHDLERLVVFSPNSYKIDWALEAEKYGLKIPLIPYEQSRLPHMVAEFNKAKGRIGFAVNYEALKYDETRGFLADVVDNRTYLGADESIKIKNPKSLFTQGAMLAVKNCAVSRIATGLPIAQSPSDFYAQGRFINMYDGLNFYAHRGKYCKMGGFKNKQVKGSKNEEELYGDIEKNAFIAKRKDWGKQSEAEFYTMRLEMAPEQQKHYDEMNRDLITMIENADGSVDEISAEQVVGKLMKMQQISSGFAYNEYGDAVEIMDPMKTPKIKALIEFIEDELTGKIVVPFYYQKSGDLLMKAFAKYNPAIITNEGWMRKNGRDVVAEKKRFNESKECRIMFGQVVSMKYGHDLTGNPQDRAMTMFFFENSFSLDDRTQVEARITTAYQDWPSMYLDPFCSAAEKRAITALGRKEDLVAAILGAYRDEKTIIER